MKTNEKRRSVFVYRNLNRKGIVFSIRCNRSGLVTDRLSVVVLKDPMFVVSKSVRLRVLKRKIRNVHAGIKGDVLKRLPPAAKRLQKVSFHYDPYKVEEFSLWDGSHIFEAKYAVLSPEGLFAYI